MILAHSLSHYDLTLLQGRAHTVAAESGEYIEEVNFVDRACQADLVLGVSLDAFHLIEEVPAAPLIAPDRLTPVSGQHVGAMPSGMRQALRWTKWKVPGLQSRVSSRSASRKALVGG